jgi:hypothetical protein
MSSHTRKIEKKHVIKKRHFTKHNKLSSINYNSIIKNVLNRFLYFTLILIFSIISLFMVGRVLKGNLNYLQNISIFFAFIVNLILFAKIISLRSNWKTLFFKYPRALSWKYILVKKKAFLLNFTLTLYSSIGIYTLTYNNFKRALNNPHFWTNSLIANFVITITALSILFLFESSFLGFLSWDKFISRIFKNVSKANSADFDESSNNQLVPDSATFQVTNSRIVLIGVLIASIFFAKLVSDQIDDYFLNSASFNFDMLFISLITTLLFFTYFITSLNSMVFKYFKWDHGKDIKSHIYILLWSFFIFINAIYFTKYLAVAMFYYPVEGNDPLTMMFLSNTITPAGMHPLEDPIFIAISTFIDYLIFSIISAILAYIVFFAQTSKKHILEVLEKVKKIVLNYDDESASSKNPMSNVIEKLFSKQFRKESFVRYYSLFFYIYCFGIPFLGSLVIMYLLVNDVRFNTGAFSITVDKYQYILGAYILLIPIFGAIHGQAEKHYKYPLSRFIKREVWHTFVKYSSIHYSIVDACLIDIFMRGVYQLSKDRGNIAPPESIQTIQSILFSIFLLGFLSISISSKLEELLIKAYDEDFDVSSKKVSNQRENSKVKV